MKYIKKFEEIEINSTDDDEFTVGKLIEELKKYDSNLPIRVGCLGYSNQEVVQIIEKNEYNNDNEYKILQINGNGSWHDDGTNTEED